MILKIGRDSTDASTFDESKSQISDYSWEYIEKVCNVVSHAHLTPTPEGPDILCMEVTYFTEMMDGRQIADRAIHSTTLTGGDMCYLMNDNGKTIERIR